jgi:V8-like Glu-specific endopeptidase
MHFAFPLNSRTIHRDLLSSLTVLVCMVALGITAHANDKVIYGEDDRLDFYQVTNPCHMSWAASVCGIIHDQDITYDIDENEWTIQPFSDYAYAIDEYTSIDTCERERFHGQQRATRCSAFLVGLDLVATAAHCIETEADLIDWYFVFGYVQEMEEGIFSRDTVPDTHVYQGIQIVGRRYIPSRGLDYAIIKLDRPIEMPCVWPLPVRRDMGKMEVGTQVGVIGHPSGLPLKISFGENSRVLDFSERHYFTTNLDAYVGNSGSPVFNAETGLVEGILVAGPQQEFNLSTNADLEAIPIPDPCQPDDDGPEWFVMGETDFTLYLCEGDEAPSFLGVVAWDVCDGNLTGNIETDGGIVVFPNVLVTTPMVFSVSDSSGNAATPLTRQVTVETPAGPYIYRNILADWRGFFRERWHLAGL